MGMAQVIAGENLGDPDGTRAINASALRAVQMDQIVRDTGVPAERIQRIARDFASRRPSLALGGGLAGAHTNGTDSLSAILALNVLIGGVGRSGGVVLNPPSVFEGAPATRSTRLADWQQAADRLRGRQ